MNVLHLLTWIGLTLSGVVLAHRLGFPAYLALASFVLCAIYLLK